jgi:hypothetical protein
MFHLGNTRRRETYVTLAFMQVKIVTSKPLSARDMETSRLSLKEIPLHTSCRKTMRPALL